MIETKYNTGKGIYKRFKVDLLIHMIKKRGLRIVKKEVDYDFIECVDEIISSKKYKEHIDLIILNMEIELDSHNNFRSSYDVCSYLSIFSTVLIFIYPKILKSYEGSFDYFIKSYEVSFNYSISEVRERVGEEGAIAKILEKFENGVILTMISFIIAILILNFIYKNIVKALYYRDKAILEIIKTLD